MFQTHCLQCILTSNTTFLRINTISSPTPTFIQHFVAFLLSLPLLFDLPFPLVCFPPFFDPSINQKIGNLHHKLINIAQTAEQEYQSYVKYFQSNKIRMQTKIDQELKDAENEENEENKQQNIDPKEGSMKMTTSKTKTSTTTFDPSLNFAHYRDQDPFIASHTYSIMDESISAERTCHEARVDSMMCVCESRLLLTIQFAFFIFCPLIVFAFLLFFRTRSEAPPSSLMPL